jgi:methylated-DNA-protein-cysteine methyltransferase-like protein
MTESTVRIIRAIRAVPKGRVSCYRDIALAAGLPNGARQTARILHAMSEKHGLPWHRIIRADGFIALESCRGRELQEKLLRAEGVRVSETGWVDLAAYGYKPSNASL